MTEKKEQTEKKPSVYERLSKIDVSHYVRKKNGLNYLSWANAWGLVKSIYPDANYSIKEYPYYTQTADGNYQQLGTRDYRRTEAGVEVEASVTIEGHTYSSKLYVMDYHNKAMNPAKVTYFEINKTQMRALAKALAFAGLGLNIYAGEDLPSSQEEAPTRKSSLQKASESIERKHAQLVAIAKRKTAQYGGGKEKVVDIVGWEQSGDDQAKLFLGDWRKKDKRNENLYQFIIKNNLETKQKASA